MKAVDRTITKKGNGTFMSTYNRFSRRKFMQAAALAGGGTLVMGAGLESAYGDVSSRGFTFQIGPYPSFGSFDYMIDASSLPSASRRKAKCHVQVRTNGRLLAEHTVPLPVGGRLLRNIKIGKMADGATYNVIAERRGGR